MKKKKRRVFYKVFLLVVGVVLTALLSFVAYFIKVTWGAKLDYAKLETANKSGNIRVYDSSLNEIDTQFLFNGDVGVEIEDLPEYVKQAFVAVEDRRFYKHNGVDYFRIFGAMFNNIKDGKFSQGASTISQQLIKNTHLTREKTIERKFKEIKLAYKLEKKFSKDEILEMYLNNIYFGNGCYGLEKAANYYFGKHAKNLTVGESALLVSCINAPSIYDPVNNNDKAENRKNIILKTMLNQGVIVKDDYEKSANNKENVVKSIKISQKSHLKQILSEVSKLLNVSINQVKNMDLIVETNLDCGVQNALNSVFSNSVFVKNNQEKGVKFGCVVVDNKTKNLVALSSSGGVDVLKNKRQPGSVIKPILVYAPAIEYGLIYPDSFIVDEQIIIDGYSPLNANKKFLGNVTIRESLEKSLNIPAVKVLSKVGVERAKNFSKKLGLEFNEKDKNLALALGGMTDGVTLKQLADAYSTFASGGTYKNSGLIKKITNKNGVVLYEDDNKEKVVMKSSTAYLISDLLKSVVKEGTARRLNSFSYNVASKTGTVGLKSSSKNTDAYNVAYTKDYTIAVWLGVDDGVFMDSSVNGSTYPTGLNRTILGLIYGDKKPDDFDFDEGVVYRYVDANSYKNRLIELAGENVSIEDKKLLIFDKNNLPEFSKRSIFVKPKLEVSMEENCKPTLIFNSEKGYNYQIIRSDFEGKKEIINSVINEEKVQKYTDYTAKSGEIYNYYVKICDFDNNLLDESNLIKLMSF